MDEIKPYIYIDDKMLPSLKTMSIDGTYELLVKVKVKNLSISTSRVLGDLEITDIELPSDEEKEINEMSDTEFMQYATNKKKNK